MLARVVAGFVCTVLVVGGWSPQASPGRTSSPTSDSVWCDLPVQAEIIDGFRPPLKRWLAGNRGLTYGTVPGSIVYAVAAGQVRFAGPIAGKWYVTVALGAGRDTTYSHLSALAVQTGELVEAGDVVGTTGSEPFHLGYRNDGTYLDPTQIVAVACGRGHGVLVPVPDGGPHGAPGVATQFQDNPEHPSRIAARPGDHRVVSAHDPGRPTVVEAFRVGASSGNTINRWENNT